MQPPDHIVHLPPQEKLAEGGWEVAEGREEWGALHMFRSMLAGGEGAGGGGGMLGKAGKGKGKGKKRTQKG